MTDYGSKESDSTGSGNLESLPSSPSSSIRSDCALDPDTPQGQHYVDSPPISPVRAATKTHLSESDDSLGLPDSSNSSGTIGRFSSPLKNQDQDISPPSSPTYNLFSSPLNGQDISPQSSPLEHGRKQHLYSLYRDNPLEPVSVHFFRTSFIFYATYCLVQLMCNHNRICSVIKHIHNS